MIDPHVPFRVFLSLRERSEVRALPAKKRLTRQIFPDSKSRSGREQPSVCDEARATARAQRIAELPAQLPTFLAIFLARRHFQSVRLFIDEQLADCFHFASHAFFLPIEID